MINYEFDTISAIATPLGVGGIGVIRISGKNSFAILEKIFSKKNITPGIIQHGWIYSEIGTIDEVVVLPFKSPNSFTGEDVVEIQCHGGISVINNILELTLKNGARLAQKGEFTKRAFLNHKIDLTQAESVLDLIHAKTSRFALSSAKNLSGTLSKHISLIRNQIFELLSKIIAAVDFPEDVNEPEYDFISTEIADIITKIDNILETAQNSNIMRQGINIAIVGRPNVGKSSLFNALLNIDRAIVTDIAGTTRDIICETIDIEGIPATLSDTAGIHANENIDKVEAIGINFSKQTIDNADLVLFLFDGTIGLNQDDEAIYELAKQKPHLKIATKSDLWAPVGFGSACSPTSPSNGCGSCTLQDPPHTAHASNYPETLNVSSLNGENIKELKSQIAKIIISKNSTETDFVTNKRQQECLNNAKNSLEIALNATKDKQIQDLISIDIKSALLNLDELSGEAVTDEILNNIFNNFCIGK